MAPTSAFRGALMLLLVATMALTAADDTPSNRLRLQQQPTADYDAEQAQELSVDGRFSAAISGCSLCARSGQCERAFRGSPGQFCQTLVSGAPCCCPADAQCVLANAYNCRCRRGAASGTRVRSTTDSDANTAPAAGSVALAVLLTCCLCCCCCCGSARERHKRRHQHDYYAEPVYTTTATQYGTNVGEYPGQQAPLPQAQPVYPYAYATAPPEYEGDRYETAKGDGGGGRLAAAALGAAGGLATGVFLGSAFGGRSGGSYQQSSTSYFDGDSGGGDFGGVSASTFEFSGDTGGGGDDGGDGDFGGDS